MADTTTPTVGYASRDQLALNELRVIVGYLAATSFLGTAAADVPDPDDDRFGDLSCDGLLAWLGDLAEHMKTKRLSFVELSLRLQSAARRQRERQAVTHG